MFIKLKGVKIICKMYCSGRYLLNIKNYTPNLALIQLSTNPNPNLKNFPEANKNFGYKHHYLSSEIESISFKLLSHRDDCSGVFCASSRRYVTISVDNYYYSIWLFIGGEWKLHISNQQMRWKGDINILNHY